MRYPPTSPILSRIRRGVLTAILLASPLPDSRAVEPVVPTPDEFGWKPVADAVWLQEVGSIVASDVPVDLVFHVGERLFAERGGKVDEVRDGAFVASDAANPEVAAAAEAARSATTRATYHESRYAIRDGRLGFGEWGRFNAVDALDWGDFAGRTPRALLAVGSRLLVATDRGLGVVRGSALTFLAGEDGLPFEDIRCLARGFDGDVWIGTSGGAVRWVGGEFQLFAGPRWLPNDRVRSIAVRDRAVAIATEGGVGLIEYEPFTLRKKAEYYEKHIEDWGQKRLGFVHKLERGGEGEWIREVSDNDGGWSAEYLAAMAFKHAATKDEAAYAKARDTFLSLVWLERASSIDGFPARSMWVVGEKGNKAQHGSGGYPAEWHPVPGGQFEWKGDTSSDETDLHYFATDVFRTVAARGADRDLATEHVRRLTSHIVDSGWFLKDVDGKPTRWGRWEPEYLQRPAGYYARGLNGLEFLTYLTVASEFAGDAKFAEAKREAMRLGYHEEVLRQKLVFTPDFVNHSDDRMAFYVYYSLLRWERDPELRGVFMRSLGRSWEIERIERAPLFNVVYGVLTGNDCELPEAVERLREWPLDMVAHSFRNSHRADLRTPPGYVAYAGGAKSLSPREVGPMRWSDNGMRLDGGAGGNVVHDPSAWLVAYWMARSHGMIGDAETDDPALKTFEGSTGGPGAAPYDGPPRPELE